MLPPCLTHPFLYLELLFFFQVTCMESLGKCWRKLDWDFQSYFSLFLVAPPPPPIFCLLILLLLSTNTYFINILLPTSTFDCGSVHTAGMGEEGEKKSSNSTLT